MGDSEATSAAPPSAVLPVLARDDYCDTTPRKHTTAVRDVVDDAQFHELAGLVLGRVWSRSEMARRLGISVQTVRKMLQDPRFRVIYARRRDKHFENLDEYVVNEKADSDSRMEALKTRAITHAAKTLDLVNERITARGAKAADLKVGADLAMAVYDRAPSSQKGRADLTVVFAPTLQQATVMRSAEQEAGLDMSDVLDVDFDIEQPPTEEPANGDKPATPV